MRISESRCNCWNVKIDLQCNFTVSFTVYFIFLSHWVFGIVMDEILKLHRFLKRNAVNIGPFKVVLVTWCISNLDLIINF